MAREWIDMLRFADDTIILTTSENDFQIVCNAMDRVMRKYYNKDSKTRNGYISVEI